MTKLLLPLLGILAFVDIGGAEAADMMPTIRGRGVALDMQRGAGPRTRVYVRPYRTAYFARRTIGMPCMLRPHVIVQANWNGPQCRWADNVTPRGRIWYRVAYR